MAITPTFRTLVEPGDRRQIRRAIFPVAGYTARRVETVQNCSLSTGNEVKQIAV
jgi:hypothetical protein